MAVPQTAPQDAWAAAQAGAVLLDVREPYEWETGRAPGSLHVPMGELAGRLDELPSEGRLIVVCRSGSRSDAVAGALARLGRSEVENLAGGLQAWQRAGLPLEPDGGRVA